MKSTKKQVLIFLIFLLVNINVVAVELAEYKITGSTTSGSQFAVDFSYDLSASPEYSDANFADWAAVSCVVMINGVTHTANWQRYIQENNSMISTLMCSLDNGVNIDIRLNRNEPVGIYTTAQALTFPVVLDGGSFNGESLNSITVIDNNKSTMSHQVIGYTSSNKYFKLSFTYDLLALPEYYDNNLAEWRLEQCEFFIDGNTYNGTAEYSRYAQSSYSESLIHCSDGFSMADVAFKKQGGFGQLDVMEVLDIPSEFVSGYVEGETVNAAELLSNQASGENSIKTYQLYGLTNTGKTFSLEFSYDLNASLEYTDGLLADWPAASCQFTLDDETYTGTWQHYLQDNHSSSSVTMSEILCEDANGVQVNVRLSNSQRFEDINLLRALEFPVQLEDGSINGESLSSVTVQEKSADSSMLSYTVTGHTDSNQYYRMSFSYDLTALPNYYDGHTADWPLQHCEYTFAGETYTGNPEYSFYLQDDVSNSGVSCSDGVHMADLLFPKPGGFARLDQAEALEVPAGPISGMIHNKMVVSGELTENEANGENVVKTYQLYGLTNTGKTFSLEFSYDLNTPLEYTDGLLADWPAASCQFTLDDESYTGTWQHYLQDNHSSSSVTMSEILCEDANGVQVNVRLSNSQRFEDISLLRALEFPVQLEAGSVNGESLNSLTVQEKSTGNSLVSYTVTGYTDSNQYYQMSFSYNLTAQPSYYDGHTADWPLQHCEYTFAGETYTGNPEYSFYLQDDVSNSGVSCSNGVHMADLLFPKPGGFARLDQAEALEVPAGPISGMIHNKMVVSGELTENEANGENAIKTYQLYGTTNTGKTFSLEFSYDLNTPLEYTDGLLADWLAASCQFTLNDESYTGTWQHYLQDNYFSSSVTMSEILCEDANGVQVNVRLSNSQRFEDISLLRALEFPVQLETGSVNGESLNSLTVQEKSTGNSLVSYTVTGYTDSNQYYQMSFSYNLTAQPSYYDGHTADWPLQHCEYTFAGETYTGNPEYSFYLQDDVSNSGVSCNDGLHIADLRFPKPGGFLRLDQPEALDIPAGPVSGIVHSQAVLSGQLLQNE